MDITRKNERDKEIYSYIYSYIDIFFLEIAENQEFFEYCLWACYIVLTIFMDSMQKSIEK
jgi:hypothetical protein